MRDIVHSYVRKFREERRERREFLGVLLCLALAVAGGIMWQFKTTGIAYTNEAQCGIEEHTHSDDCYAWVLTGETSSEETAVADETQDAEAVVVETAAAENAAGESLTKSDSEAAAEAETGIAEDTTDAAAADTSADGSAAESETAATSETMSAASTESTAAAASEETLPVQVLLAEAVETEDWYLSHGYEKVLICGKEEHIHTIECLSDETADLETAEVWEAALPSLTGVWADDVVAIAESQIGYAESTLNFTLAEDGTTRKGYTRYGAWYGNAYGDWDAMFAAFCLHYAGISESDFPVNSGAYAWSVSLKEAGLYQAADSCTPAAGDLAFLDKDQDGTIDTVAVITNVNDTTLTVVEGNSNDAVEENSYKISDSVVAGYGVLPEQNADSLTGLTKTYTAEAETEDGSVIVTITAPYGALPNGAELVVTLLDEDSDAYAKAAEAIGYDGEDENTGMAALDISFLVDGEGVEPSEPVTVSIDASAIIPEEVDASTIEVQHLAETDAGVEPVLVADVSDDTEGTVDEETVIAEFEVDGFSTFTVTWTYGPGNNSKASFEVTVYIGTEVYTGSIADVSATLSMNGSESVNLSTLLTDYEFDHAEVAYSTSSSSNLTTLIATAISFTDGGNGGSYYTITTTNGTITNVTAISEVKVYYKTNAPSVSISAEGSDDEGYTLTATPSNFTDTPGYSWEITSGSDYATIETNSDGTATVIWSEDAEDGDSVTVQVTATYGEGNEAETATDTYTLTYGQVELTVYVTYNGNTAASGATVTLKDSEGNTVDEATADSEGKVTFSVANVTTYTISASYTVSSSVTLSDSETIIVSGDTAETIELSSSATISTSKLSSNTSFGHIDIKTTGAESEGSEGYTLTSITSVVIKNSSGTTLYTSSSVTGGDTSGEWRISFNPNNVTIYTSYSITITYVVTDTEGNEHTYPATIDSSSTYAEGTTYSANGDGAYKLYNYLYGTSYSSNNELKNAGITEVDISGMSVFLVAAILCNGSTVSGYNNLSKTDGLDFVLDLGTLLKYSANWDFEVEKIFENSGMTAGQFTFILANASVTDDNVWTIGNTLQTQTNSTVNAGPDGDSTDTISFTQINYSSDDEGTYYYIIYEENGGTTVDGIAYSSAVYGVVVSVTVSSSTSGSTTTKTTAVTATYYNLTWDSSSGGYVVNGDAINTWIWSSTSSTLVSLPFTNSYASSTDLTIVKVDADSTSTTLSGAEFMLTSSDGTTYYKADGTVGTSEDMLTTGSDGKISVTGLSNGTYTLTEVTAPDGYNLLTYDITITVSNGSVSVSYAGNTDTITYVSYDSDTATITVKNDAGAVLPSTGGPGIYLYTLAGLLLILSAVCLMYKNLRRKGDLPY